MQSSARALTGWVPKRLHPASRHQVVHSGGWLWVRLTPVG
jgi:hypothetical protein